MGSYLYTSQQQLPEPELQKYTYSTTQHQEIADEIRLKMNETTIMLVGNSDSGKSTIMNNIIQCYFSTQNRNDFIRCRYDLELFTIREYTDPSISEYSYSSFKHLELIHKSSQSYKQSQPSKYEIYKISAQMMKSQSTENNMNNKSESIVRNGIVNSKYDESLVFGFINKYAHTHVDFPMDLKVMTLVFYASIGKSIVTSYKFRFGHKIYNIWDTSGNDFMCANLTQLYPWIDDIIFVMDGMRFYERYPYNTVHAWGRDWHGENEYNNMMEYDIELFKAMTDDICINYKQNCEGQIKIVFNIRDALTDELEQITITKLESLQKNMSFESLIGINSDKYSAFGAIVKNQFLKGIGGSVFQRSRYIFADAQATDKEAVRKLFEFFYKK